MGIEPGLVEPDFRRARSSRGTASRSGRRGVRAARALVRCGMHGGPARGAGRDLDCRVAAAEPALGAGAGQRGGAGAGDDLRRRPGEPQRRRRRHPAEDRPLSRCSLSARAAGSQLVDALAAKAEADGATLRTRAAVRGLERGGRRLDRSALDEETLRADVVVVAAGGPDAVAKLLGERAPAAPGPAAELSVLDLGLRTPAAPVPPLRARRRQADLPLPALAARTIATASSSPSPATRANRGRRWRSWPTRCSPAGASR